MSAVSLAHPDLKVGRLSRVFQRNGACWCELHFADDLIVSAPAERLVPAESVSGSPFSPVDLEEISDASLSTAASLRAAYPDKLVDRLPSNASCRISRVCAFRSARRWPS